MPKKRKLSKDEKNRRRRARAAELRAVKARRSEASKKGWTKRRLLARVKQLEKALEEKEKEWAAAILNLRNEAPLSKEEADARLAILEKYVLTPKQIEESNKRLYDIYHKQETKEERSARMRTMWREVDGIVPGKNMTRREGLLSWVQRNGFDLEEFWAEYRRRAK